MFRPRSWVKLFLAGFLFWNGWNGSLVWGEAVATSGSPALPTPGSAPHPSTQISLKNPIRPMAVAERPREAQPFQEANPSLSESPRPISLDLLRREISRYPDQDLLGRFAEVATELPPLFGSDR